MSKSSNEYGSENYPDYVVFADGSVDVNKNEAHSHGAAAAVILKISRTHIGALSADEVRLRAFHYSGFSSVTNNTMEIRAIYHGIDCCKEGSLIDLWSDSQYALGSIFNPTWKPGANKPLIRLTKELIKSQGYDIREHHIRGHRGYFLNELVDLVAKKAIERKKGIKHTLEIHKDTDLECWACARFPCNASSAKLPHPSGVWKPKFAAIRDIQFLKCQKFNPYAALSWNGTNGS